MKQKYHLLNECEGVYLRLCTDCKAFIEYSNDNAKY